MSGSHNSRTRSEILARLREAAPAGRAAAPDLAAYYGGQVVPDRGELAARFVKNARGWRAEIIECAAAHWAEALHAVVVAKNIRHLAAGRGTPLAAALAALPPPLQLHWFEQPLEQFKPTLFDHVDAAVTTTRGGIADTGSLIVWPDANEPRTLSLVPPIHIAVLHESQLHATLYAALHAQGWAARMPTNALLVTGPSKTADIQRLLVYGAHGPRQLVVLLLRGEAA